jgi:hypothetical protein
LITIYSKSEQGDVSAKDLTAIIKEFGSLQREIDEGEGVKEGKKNGSTPRGQSSR